MAKEHLLEDRIRAKKDVIQELSEMLADPTIKCLLKSRLIVTSNTARKVAEIIDYANAHKTYIEAYIRGSANLELNNLIGIYKDYCKKRLN